MTGVVALLRRAHAWRYPSKVFVNLELCDVSTAWLRAGRQSRAAQEFFQQQQEWYRQQQQAYWQHQQRQPWYYALLDPTVAVRGAWTLLGVLGPLFGAYSALASTSLCAFPARLRLSWARCCWPWQ